MSDEGHVRGNVSRRVLRVVNRLAGVIAEHPRDLHVDWALVVGVLAGEEKRLAVLRCDANR